MMFAYNMLDDDDS